MQALSNLFIEGPRGVGKSTLLFRLLRQHGAGLRLGGFAVKRVCTRGVCVGLDLTDLATRQRGRLVTYGADRSRQFYLDVFTTVGVPAIERAIANSDLVIMDELGRLELTVPGFMDAVESALASPRPVLGVLKDVANPFLDGIRPRPDVRVIRLDASERDEAAREYREALMTLLRRLA